MRWRNDTRSYGLVTVLFHWAIAILFLVQLPLGYLTQATQNRPVLQFDLYQWHKSLGLLILALAVPRLVWALVNPRPVEPEGLTASERAAARAAHIVLYALTVFVPLAGWAVVSSSPLRIPTYAFNAVVIPDLPITVSDAREALWSSIHAFLAYSSAFIAAVHILAALRHHFRFRDAVLIRMLRPGRSDRSRRAV
ncbi:MAG: cytochrome b [Pararhizobium sp.]